MQLLVITIIFDNITVNNLAWAASTFSGHADETSIWRFKRWLDETINNKVEWLLIKAAEHSVLPEVFRRPSFHTPEGPLVDVLLELKTLHVGSTTYPPSMDDMAVA